MESAAERAGPSVAHAFHQIGCLGWKAGRAGWAKRTNWLVIGRSAGPRAVLFTRHIRAIGQE